MSRAVVIGVGSPFGADRLGWDTVSVLEAHGLSAGGEGVIRLCRLDRPGSGLLEAVTGADLAVIVDAVRTGAAPGTLHRFPDPTALPAGAPVSSHGFGLGEALGLGAALGELPPRVVVLGAEAEPGQNLPADTLSRLAGAVRAELRTYLGDAALSD